ncbi:phospholipase D-like domain-containing protein [Thiocapsa rosea]|uniref:phospholipase D-like domain-containing protein n=1 Tax=Thiocapsa rosea TaxID=69360 RepID=UPI001FE8EE68|nr:phospholipase D-like domain-containing protein [Thiocapsa rosea]
MAGVGGERAHRLQRRSEDLKVAQLREARMPGRWNERSIEAESLLNRERYRRLDAFLARRGQVIRVAPDSLCGFLHGKAGMIERADGRKVGFIGSMNETRHGWQKHYEILQEDDTPEDVAWIEAESSACGTRRGRCPRRSARRFAGAGDASRTSSARSRPRRPSPRRR